MIDAATYDGWMTTFSGRRFYPLSPRAADVDLLDIAHALAMTCRYGGHAPRFYSVAEHSVLVSRLCPTPNALEGLLHDAAEAYTADLPMPLKRGLAGWDGIERGVERAIADRFGLVGATSLIVTALDKRIVADEMAQLWGEFHAPSWVKPCGVSLSFWNPAEARDAFMRRFHEITAAP